MTFITDVVVYLREVFAPYMPVHNMIVGYDYLLNISIILEEMA